MAAVVHRGAQVSLFSVSPKHQIRPSIIGTDCLHRGLTGAHWPLPGALLEVIEAKGRRFIIDR
jgi:hypothetical protein